MKSSLKAVLTFVHFFIVSTALSQPSPRIKYGTNAERGAWPSQVLFVNSFNPNRSAWCGGSLISEEWVLTAAYCFTLGFPNGSTFWNGIPVILGEYDRRNKDDTEVYRNISWVITLSESNFTDSRLMHTDVALIRFTPPVDFTSDEAKHLKPMCLDMDGISITNKDCIATGFGEERDPPVPDILQQLQMQHIEWKECEQRLKEIYQEYNKKEQPILSDVEMCFDSKIGAICQSDLGSSVQCKYENGWFQVGIVTRAPMLLCHGMGIFSSVQKHIDFIKRHTGYKLPKYCLVEERLSAFSIITLLGLAVGMALIVGVLIILSLYLNRSK